MDLQTLFYAIGLVYMVLGIALLLTLVVVVIYVMRRVTQLERTIERKLEIISEAARHPAEAALGIGASIAEIAVEKFKDMFDKKKKT